jgi:GT2 family glycosyltransferase
MDDISIGIVAYNDEEDVRAAVESIERYTSEDIKKKIYIIDNSTQSNDLRKMQETYQDVRYIKMEQNIGFGGGHNYILPELDSKFHAIVNPDIILDSDAFLTLIDFMQDETVGMCVPRLLDEEGNLLAVYRRELTVCDMFIRMFAKRFFLRRQAYHTMQDMDYHRPFDVPFAQGSFLVIRTDLFRRLGGFDEQFFLYMEDADLCKRVNEVSVLRYCPMAAVIHKWERGSHKSKALFQMHLKSMRIYFQKWGWRML